MNENKKVGIFIVVIALVLLAAMLIYTYGFKKSQNANNVGAAITGPVKDLMADAKNSQPKPTYNYNAQAEANRTLTAEDLRKMSLSFAERFGSFSNQSNYSNFEDLKIFMSDNMKKWSDGYVADLEKAATSTTAYYGISTIAISGEVKKFNTTAGQAEVVVSTQRREQSANSSSANVFNQNITLDFVKVGNDWKVDAAYWDKN